MFQLSKPITIVIGILAFGALAYNFYDDPIVSHLLGKEVNNWLYRAFWVAIIAISIYNYINIDRNTLKNKSKMKSKSSLGSAREPSRRSSSNSLDKVEELPISEEEKD